MSVSLTVENKRVLRALRRTGRWANDSEIIRYGIYLVLKEVQAEQKQRLAPYPYKEVAKAYTQDTPEDRAMEELLGKASSRFKPDDDLS